MTTQPMHSYRTGVVAVHGIGRQREGDAAGEATQCLERFAPSDLRVESTFLYGGSCKVPLPSGSRSAGTAGRPAALLWPRAPQVVVAGASVDTLDHELSITPKGSKTGKARPLLVTEAYWDNLVQPPASHRLTLWCTVMAATVMWHYASTALFLDFDAWRTGRRGGSFWRRTVGPWLSMIFNAFFFTVATPLVAVATFIAGLALGLVQYAAPRSRLARAAHSALSDTVGDAWAYTSTDQGPILVAAVRRRIEEVREQCERVIVVGHSQGAELARRALVEGARAEGFGSIGSGQLVLGAIQLARKSLLVLVMAWLSIVMFPLALYLSSFWVQQIALGVAASVGSLWDRATGASGLAAVGQAPAPNPTHAPTEPAMPASITAAVERGLTAVLEFPLHYALTLLGFALFCALIFVFHRRPVESRWGGSVRRIDVYNTFDPVSFGAAQFPDARAIRPRFTLRTLGQVWTTIAHAHTQYWQHRTTGVAMWDLILERSSPVPARRTPSETRIAWTLKAFAAAVCAVLSYLLGAGLFALLPFAVRLFLLTA
ncbi:hypothetical protein JT358_09495 [Micrococcales bacterium 31B]|nr:hypothetical protein [Micrococcales bacterium 31B]